MTCLHTHGRYGKYDPTRTTTLRVQYEREMRKRFNRLSVAIDDYLVKNNALRVNADFDFPSSAQKVSQFTRWLKSQSRLIVVGGNPITSANKTWQSLYIDSAYQRGLSASAAKLRGQGATVKDSYVDSAFFRPRHADAVGIIYTRTYTDLEGITSAMDAKISKTLATGMGEGLGVAAIASELNDVVNGLGLIRARTLTRTEVISAYAKASINAYRDAGIDGVTADVEFATADDDAVCPECDALEGKVYSLDEADGVIPVHPNCRCSWLPVVRDVSQLNELS